MKEKDPPDLRGKLQVAVREIDVQVNKMKFILSKTSDSSSKKYLEGSIGAATHINKTLKYILINGV